MLSDQGGERVTHRGAMGIPKQAQPSICVERCAVIVSISRNNNYRSLHIIFSRSSDSKIGMVWHSHSHLEVHHLFTHYFKSLSF